MSVNFILLFATVASLAALSAQWVLLRSRYLNGLDQQRARHQQHQQSTQAQLEIAKQQIGRLQRDLSTRLRTQREGARATGAPQRSRSDSPALPVDGFADTLPTPQYPHDIRLLKH